MAKPSVKSAKMNNYGDALVEFKDGHRVVFARNNGGFGESTTVEAILLYKNNCLVVTYHSPYQYPRNRRGDGIQDMVKGYTVQQFTDYVVAASDYSARRAKNRDWTTWREISKANSDLRDLKAGKVKIANKEK